MGVETRGGGPSVDNEAGAFCGWRPGGYYPEGVVTIDCWGVVGARAAPLAPTDGQMNV